MRLEQYLNESGLGGESSSGGKPNWDHYIVDNFDINNEYVIDKDGKLIDKYFKHITDVNKNDKIRILSTNLLKKGKSSFAFIRYKGIDGYININTIQKPKLSKDKESVFASNSKEFAPDKLNIEGIKYSNKNMLIRDSIVAMEQYYGEKKYEQMRNYLNECMNTINNTSFKLTESKYNKKYKISGNYNITQTDIGVLSKNFGEVLAGIFILTTNKKCSHIEYPSNIAQGLYDFSMIDNRNITYYYSVKSKGGSSTSMANLNFILKHFSNNSFFTTYKNEVNAILRLINSPTDDRTTLSNIIGFFDDIIPNKKNEILSYLNRISKKRISDLTMNSLSMWFDDITTNSNVNDFIRIINEIYNNVMSDVGGKGPNIDDKILREMFMSGNPEKKYKHGYLLYPMGSYIVKYLNNIGKYKEVLNILLNYGTFIQQIEIDLNIKDFDITISKFKSNNFRFSYNGMSKKPGNRPVGFIQI